VPASALERCFKQLTNSRTDEFDIIAGERLIGRQSKYPRAQMLGDGKLPAAHAQGLRGRLQVDGRVVMHHRLHPPFGEMLLQLVAPAAPGHD
jgi:hypothetical protein